MTTMIMMTMMMTTMNDHDDDYDDHDDDYDDQTMESRDGCPSMHALTRSHATGTPQCPRTRGRSFIKPLPRTLVGTSSSLPPPRSTFLWQPSLPHPSRQTPQNGPKTEVTSALLILNRVKVTSRTSI